MIFPGFCGPTYSGYATNISAERCINWFPELIEQQPNGKNRYALVPSPGLTSYATLTGAGTSVTSLYFDRNTSRLFAICGTKFDEISEAGVVTNRGTVSSAGDNPTYIASNGTQLCIVSNTSVYTFTLATNVFSAAIAGVTLGDVSFIDGYFVGTSASTNGQFRISALYDGATWSALDFASAEASPDYLSRVTTHARQLWCFGIESVQVFTNTGNADFPFEPIAGAVLPVGTFAPASVVALDSSLFWVGQDATGGFAIFRSEGFGFKRISTYAVERYLATLVNELDGSSLASAAAYGFLDRGHLFYHLYVPAGGASWRYDLSTDMWHEVGDWGGSSFTKHPTRCHAYAYNAHIVGSHDSNLLYRQTSTVYKERGGSAMRRERICPHLTNENKRTFYNALELDMETGVGNVDNTDPVISLAWSNDGGYTFGSFVTRPIGASGVHPRVRWNRLGSARDRVFKVMLSAPVNAVLTQAYLDIEPGAH